MHAASSRAMQVLATWVSGCAFLSPPFSIRDPTHPPVDSAPRVSINLHEQLRDLGLGEVFPEVRAKLLNKVLDVEFTGAILVSLLR